MNAIDIIFAWHNLPLSVQRKIAAQFGIPACGATPRHLWTSQIIEAASDRGEIDKFKKAVVAAAAAEPPQGSPEARQDG